MKKKILIILIVVIVLALAAFLFFRMRGPKEPLEVFEDGGYTFTLEEKRKFVRMTIDGEFPANSAWSGVSGNTVGLQVTEERQNGRSAAFRLTPAFAGIYTATFTLTGTENGLAIPYDTVDLRFEIDQDRKLSLLSRESSAAETLISGGGEEFRYVVAQKEKGLEIRTSTAEAENWDLFSGGDRVDAELTKQEDGSCIVSLTGYAWGKAVVMLKNTGVQKALKLAVSVDENGIMNVTSYEDVTLDPDAAMQEDEELFRAAFGDPQTPESSEMLKTGLVEWTSESNGKSFTVGLTQFRMDGIRWSLYAGEGVTLDDFIYRERVRYEEAQAALAPEEPSEEEAPWRPSWIPQTEPEPDPNQATLFGHDVTAYPTETGVCAAWEQDGRVWRLDGENAGAEQILQTLRTVMKVTLYG